MSDAGRILRLADAESAKADRRRVSVLCIDSAPNEALASQLAERGGGVSRFLTSNPDEDDITTALDEVLADWSAPVLTGLTLEVNRAGVEAAGRTVVLVAPGSSSAIDVGDLPVGRPVWMIGRVPAGTGPLSFRLSAGATPVAEVRVEGGAATPGLKALFGADRVRRLEYVMTANYAGEELRAELARLGYDAPASEPKLYAENAGAAAGKIVRELIVRESLAASVPSSETAFVAVRTEAGKPVTETRIVANALPAGWSDGFASRGIKLASTGLLCAGLSAPPFAAAEACESVDSMLVEFDDLDDDEDATVPAPMAKQKAAPLPPASVNVEKLLRASSPTGWGLQSHDVRISVKAGQHSTGDGAVLLGSASGGAGQFTFLSVAFADKAITADTLDPELTLLLFVGDLATPRARVKLVDVLRAGGRRPLNIRRDANLAVRLVVEDPADAWKGGIPALEVVLGVA